MKKIFGLICTLFFSLLVFGQGTTPPVVAKPMYQLDTYSEYPSGVYAPVTFLSGQTWVTRKYPLFNFVHKADSTLYTSTYAFRKAMDSLGLIITSVNNSIANYVTKATTITINNVTYDLSQNRSWTIAAGGGTYSNGYGLDLTGSVFSFNKTLRDSIIGLIPTSTQIGNWNAAYNKRITSIAITGTSPKTITITFADNTAVSGTFTDISGTGGSSYSFTSPLSDNGSGVVSIQAASAIQAGYLTQADWNTFNGKQAQLNGSGLVRMSGTVVSYDNTDLTTKENGITAPYTTGKYWNGYKQFVVLNTDSIGQGAVNLFVTSVEKATWGGKQDAITTTLTVPTLYGSSIASGNIVLQSTSNAAKGNIDLGTFWRINSSGHLLAQTDNAYDLGANANRLRNLYVAGQIFAQSGTFNGYQIDIASGGYYGWGSGRSLITSPSDGNITLYNRLATSFGLLQFGGATLFFPAIQRLADTIAIRKADNSADTWLKAYRIRLTGTDSVGSPINMIWQDANGYFHKAPVPSGSGSGSGTVTSIVQGVWMNNSANPITNSGTLNVDSSAIVARMKQIAHDSITPIKNISLWTDDYTIKGNGDSASSLHVDTTVIKTVWRARQDSIALAAADGGGGGGAGTPVGANMYRLAAQTFSAGVDTKVLLDNTQFDNSGTMADLTNHRINIPSTGLYIITIFARLSNGGAGECEMKVKLNGSATEFMRAGVIANSSGDAIQLNNSMVVSLTASDYIELFINPAFSASSLGTSYEYLAPRIAIAKIK